MGWRDRWKALEYRSEKVPVAAHSGDEFEEECREAFHRLIEERNEIDLKAQGKRQDNGKKWLKKQTAINDVLDQYNSWRDLRADLEQGVTA